MEQFIFQFTPLREGRRPSEWRYCRQNYFNSRPSARGDAKKLAENLKKVLFQFTPLREGRHARGRVYLPNGGNFNSRPSARGDKRLISRRFLSRNFNSRPSARGDKKLAENLKKGIISIHAPPRGATALHLLLKVADSISIHAPPRGATNTSSSATNTL